MIKIANIYINITGYLLQLIHFHRCRENIQHSMFDHPDFDNIPIGKYKLEIFTTFMLSDGAYITCSFNWVYVEVIANIQF